jgi:hypothetical protein
MLFKEILATFSENYAKNKNGFTVWVACNVFKLMYIVYIDTIVVIKGYSMCKVVKQTQVLTYRMHRMNFIKSEFVI